MLTMAGSYRPPLGAVGEVLDRAILRRVAAATIRSFVAQVAAQITGQARPSDGAGRHRRHAARGEGVVADVADHGI